MQLFSHVLDHCGEQVQNFGVTSILSVRFVIVDEQLELRQELLVEDCIGLVLLFENVGLDEFKNVSSHSFHRLDHWVVQRILADHSLRDLLRVEVVDFEKVTKNIPEVIKVDETSALSNALIYFNYVID